MWYDAVLLNAVPKVPDESSNLHVRVVYVFAGKVRHCHNESQPMYTYHVD